MRLKELRKKNNLSQEELAQLLNVGQNTISRYENGDREPSIEQLKQLADIFKCTIDCLLEYEKEEK